VLKTEVAYNNDENMVKDIISIKGTSFPSGWEYSDAQEYYSEMLKHMNNVNIFLKNDEKRIGYLLAIPHNNAVIELRNDDPLMRKDASRYYLETVAILPEYRKKNGFSSLLKTLKQELEKRGVHNISLHARVANDFSLIIQKKLKITHVRRIVRWKYCNYEEPVDYIEAAI